MWIAVGLPDEKRIRKACGRADKVIVYTYGGRAAQLWWQQAGDTLARQEKLTVVDLPQEATRALAGFATRNMDLQVTIQDGQIWISNAAESVHLEPDIKLAANAD